MDDQYLTIRAAVAIPACQAAVNGLFFGGAVGGIAATANHLGLLSIDAAAVAVAVGCTAALKAWSGLLRDWRGLLYGIDVDDQEPETTYQPVRVSLISDDGRQGQFANLPATADQLMRLGAGVAAGEGFTVARWTGAGGPFSRGQFERLRAELLRQGWLVWRSDHSTSQGVDVTRGGMAVFRYFASMSETYTLSKK